MRLAAITTGDGVAASANVQLHLGHGLFLFLIAEHRFQLGQHLSGSALDAFGAALCNFDPAGNPLQTVEGGFDARSEINNVRNVKVPKSAACGLGISSRLSTGQSLRAFPAGAVVDVDGKSGAMSAAIRGDERASP
jgi:hypothetical protein